jgi:hypothetical protein
MINTNSEIKIPILNNLKSITTNILISTSTQIKTKIKLQCKNGCSVPNNFLLKKIFSLKNYRLSIHQLINQNRKIVSHHQHVSKAHM